MVLPGEREYMATERERSKPLHNFTFPYLKWGNQRHLRCMKVESASGGSVGAADNHRLRRRSRPTEWKNSSETVSACSVESELRNKNQQPPLGAAPSRSDCEEGIDKFREKIMLDLRTVADKMKESILMKEALDGENEEEETEWRKRQKGNEKQEEKEREVPSMAAEGVMPWNLRTRRASCKAPIGGAGNNNGNDHRYNNNKGSSSSPLRSGLVKSARVKERETEKKERHKFCVSLTRKEIEQDFMEFLGHRPPRRPKKRPRTVQKELDLLFPGLYLTEVTPDSYKVSESEEKGKR